MGNCMKGSRSGQMEEEEKEIEKACEKSAKTGFEKENGTGKGSMKVKIVLSKEELELFLVKLEKNKNGLGKSLDDLLAEMEQARSVKHDSWRPSSESIMEDDPQGLELMEDNY